MADKPNYDKLVGEIDFREDLIYEIRKLNEIMNELLIAIRAISGDYRILY